MSATETEAGTIYYHFTANTLRDGTPVPAIGEWLVFKGDPVPCQCGFHASPDPFDALQYAPGHFLHQVELGGKIVPHGKPCGKHKRVNLRCPQCRIDKYAAQKRKIIATIDATDLMRLFARRVALDVIHLWHAPPVVREYLETGDDSKRAAARDAAWAAAGAAARAAAARDAARAAARDAAWAAARDAARAAAWAAAGAKYRLWFNEMVGAAFAQQAVTHA